jgi:hypothetical protein
MRATITVAACHTDAGTFGVGVLVGAVVAVDRRPPEKNAIDTGTRYAK